MTDLLAARWQMGLSLAFHIIYAALGVGLPVLILAAEYLHLRTRDPAWMTLARRWSKAFAVLFAVGAVSGTVLSVELGLLWPVLMGRFGAALGLPFTLEAFAFFLEAIFLGIYLYGWDRLSPRAHFLCGLPIVISGAASAAFVTCVNAWMNTPVGFTLDEAGRIATIDPLAWMRTPAAGAEVVHMLVAAFCASGLAVASVYAAGILRGRQDPHHKKGMALGLALGLSTALLQPLSGDWAAKVVARSQPVKLAAMEGQWETRTHAPLRLGGLPDEAAERTPYALELPGGLSWLAHGDPAAEVRGLSAVPRDLRPRTAVVHLAFQLMVAIGSALALLALLVGALALLRRRLPRGRPLLLAIAASGPAAFLAIEAGWTVTEVGRQPWTVQGVLRTAHAATTAPGLVAGLVVSLLVYGALGGGTVLILLHLARKSREPPAGSA